MENEKYLQKITLSKKAKHHLEIIVHNEIMYMIQQYNVNIVRTGTDTGEIKITIRGKLSDFGKKTADAIRISNSWTNAPGDHD